MTEETNSPKEVITTFEQWWALHGQGMARVQVLTMWHLEKVAQCAWNASRQTVPRVVASAKEQEIYAMDT